MPIQLTSEQWASVAISEQTVRVSGPGANSSFVLIPADDYERFKSLFEADRVRAEERQHHLQQFGKRAGWDDPAMDVYEDFDPRRMK